MLNFFKRFGRALADILTSKKAIATIGGAVATGLGVPAPIVAAVVGPYVVGQGIADAGKERAKKEAQLGTAQAPTERTYEAASGVRIVGRHE